MALGDLVACKRGLKGGIMTEQRMGLRMPLFSVPDHNTVKQAQSANVRSTNEETDGDTGIVYLPQTVFLSGLRWVACKGFVSAGSADIGLVSKWRMKDRMKTGCVALVLCLNIGVDPPDAIRISPCARTECWIDPFSFPSHKALEAIGKTLQLQYKQWQPKAPPPHKVELDPTVDAVKQLCLQSRESAKSDRVLFHYNGHGVPKPTENGNIWVFNKNCTQYIPLSFYDLESWLGMPALYVFDCSAAGMILKTFCERPEWAFSGSSTSALRSCILLAACGSQEVLPQHSDLPADIFTSCLTTPIKVALKWFCRKSLLQPAVNPELIDKIPGRQDDRKTPLGELNWIFTAVTDTIAWNVLPPELFQRLFRQDLLVASLFRNFLLAERVMRSANCTPQSYPTIPRTHQHPMWHAWDMAAEMCLAQFPAIINNFTEFKPSSFFSEQLTAFEVWLEHGSERKRPPEQLPIVLQVVLSKSHRARALMLLGRFLDLGAWAIDLALSVGIFPCVLKLLQTTTVEIRQILVFIWTKLLALDKSCQVDLVKDGRHLYFIRFLDSPDVYGEQRAMSAFVLAVIVDGYQRGQEVCMQAGLISICLKHAKYFSTVEGHSEPLLLQCLCLCLGKIWDSFPDAQQLGFEGNAPVIFMQLLTEAQPEVRASAIFALGTLISSGNMVSGSCPTSDDEDEDFERHQAEHEIASTLLTVLFDGSPLVRSELAIALSRFASSHNNQFRRSAASYAPRSAESSVAMKQNLVLRVSYKGAAVSKEQNAISSLHGSPSSEDLVNSVTRRQGEGDSLYMQCISALFVLETDPCAQVARIGEQVLQTIGIDLQCACDVRAGSGSSRSHSRSPSLSPSRSHHRNSSAGSVPWNIVSGLPRSVSWINLNSGNLTTMFRTPPASPPTQKSVLAGNGMRRVYSLEFSRHTQQTTDAGLADATVIGTPQVFRSETVPSSTLYSWSRSHFSRPLIEPSCFDDEEILLRRQDRERLALDGIAKCEQSSVARVSDQVASWDTGAQNSVEAVMLHPFMQVVCSIDEHEVLRVWDYEKGFLMNAFENHNVAEKGVSRLFLLNELDDDLLLVASSDGTVRVWKDYMQDNMQCLVTAWQAVTPRLNASKAVVDWQQLTGYLYASCEKSPIMVWDLNRELRACNLISQSDSSISALSASPILSQHVTAGYSDGSIRVFDLRSPDIVCTIAPHKQRIVGLDFLPGKDTDKIVSASVAGDLKFIDMRKTATPYLDVDACVDTLSAIAVHRHAPLIAIGSAKQYIKVFNEYGKLISELRHVHNSFFAQKLGSICALSFHPYKVYLAAGATDSFVSIYSGNDDQFI